ncbi:MAG: universal stress protein [Gammaproteobacteria bacterium]|nr:universal stress protein [Gammaproteobacteria bacterium]
MADYKNILAAVDYTAESHQVLQRAKNVAEQSSAEITLLHVIEITPVIGEFETFSYVDLYTDQPEMIDRAERDLKSLADDVEMTDAVFKVIPGVPKVEIASYAEEYDIDLIVVGSHGRHGISLILGSTANGVLHRAKCDVLAVRV